MDKLAENSSGYVYILEVKDISLPVCKIGMTTRTPYERCNEINSGATGDFIWVVAYFIVVDKCKEFESLVHSKLAPLRQKGREFFNLSADDAHVAIISILENQTNIKRVRVPEGIDSSLDAESDNRGGKRKYHFQRIDSRYVELLQIFSSCLNVKGRPFGQLNRPIFGISDGREGVQWNISVDTETGKVRIGVNLEGSAKTGRWLITPFILNNPDIEKLKSKIESPNDIVIRFSRDAWQGASRLNIRERFVGGREYLLSELNRKIWGSILDEALTCLDENKGFRGRKRNYPVTLESDGRKLKKDISPHLTIWAFLSIDGNIEDNIKMKISELQHVYDWVLEAIYADKAI